MTDAGEGYVEFERSPNAPARQAGLWVTMHSGRVLFGKFQVDESGADQGAIVDMECADLQNEFRSGGETDLGVPVQLKMLDSQGSTFWFVWRATGTGKGTVDFMHVPMGASYLIQPWNIPIEVNGPKVTVQLP